MSNPTRIAPAEPPFPPEIQKALDATMPPGVPPLVLFTTLARDPRLFGKFFAGGLLDRGHLSMRQREIVIHRVTGRCRGDYEFCVHAGFFAKRVGFDGAALQRLAHGRADDPAWSADEQVLLRTCDALLADCDIDDDLWAELTATVSAPAAMEIILLVGFYRTVSCLVRALRLPAEPWSPPFPAP